MKRHTQGSGISHDRWLVSYADFVTLLFAFFVVLYASAQMDKQRAVRLSDAIESAFQQLGMFADEDRRVVRPSPVYALTSDHQEAQPSSPATAVPTKEDLNGIRHQFESALAHEISRNEVALRMNGEGLVLSLREAGFFDSGSAVLKPGAAKTFSRIANILREHAYAIRIEGHTDNVPIHTAQFASNWELSTARASELVKVLIEEYGLSAGRLSAAGYAEFHPVSDNSTANGRRLNRRVDLVILRPAGVQAVAGETVAEAGGQSR